MKYLAYFLLAAGAFAQPPGATLPVGLETVCSKNYSKEARSERPVSASLRRAVLARDGYPVPSLLKLIFTFSKGLIIDHVIPVELGGSNAIDNLQVQTKDAAHRKDLVENRLHKMVCVSGSLSLAQAQREMAHYKDPLR